MEINWEGIAVFLTALAGFSGIILPIVNSKVKRAEKRYDIELERLRRETDEKQGYMKARLSTVYSSIYGYLWKSMFRMSAQRVGILQPHPLSHKQYFSCSFEIVEPDSGIQSCKREFQFKRMAEWSNFVSRLSAEGWMIYTDIENIKDKKVYAEAHRRGVRSLFFRRLTDADGNWIGTLYAEFFDTVTNPAILANIKGEMERKAMLIQDILPEYKPLMPAEQTNV